MKNDLVYQNAVYHTIVILQNSCPFVAEIARFLQLTHWECSTNTSARVELACIAYRVRNCSTRTILLEFEWYDIGIP